MRLVALLALALACGVAVAPAAAQSPDIDSTLEVLRKQVDTAQETLKRSTANDAKDPVSDAALQQLRSTAQDAQTQADAIADQLTPQLAGVNARIGQLGTAAAGVKEDPDIARQRDEMAKARSTFDGQQKLARLIALDSAQLIEQTRVARRSQFQARLGERTHSILGRSFWGGLRDDLPHDRQRLAVLLAQLATAARATPLAAWLAAPVVLFAGWWLFGWSARRMLGWLGTRTAPGRLRRSLQALLTVLRWTLTFGLGALVLDTLLEWTHTLPDDITALLGAVVGMLWFGGFIYGLVSALICARQPSWRLLPLPDPVAERLAWFAPQITLVTLAAWLAERLVSVINASLSMTVAVNCVVALAMGVVVARALLRGERAWRQARLADADQAARAAPLWQALFAGLAWLVLLGSVASLLTGFVAFGSFAIQQVVWGGIVVGTGYLLAALIDDGLAAWLGSAPPAPAAGSAPAAEKSPARASAQIGVVASGVLRLAVMLLALMLLLAPFGGGPADILRRGGQWQDGLAIGEFHLQPGAVLQALVVLLLVLGAARLLGRWLTDRYLPTTSLDAGMRASMISLFGYAGWIVAVALAMSAMGIGLERIAWVASALSVGIGFGLQAVVQNFVSGLILLAERPVKVGDWVSLGGVEGDIRRINVRATEIQMGDRSTVIVPNSEFITKVVRNVTLADPLGLVQVKLPVPLSTDPEAMRSLLLAAFVANPDVLETPGPNVMLDGIEGGQLIFNATGFANSPRLSGKVKSALLFDILQRLSDAKIPLSKPATMLLGSSPLVPMPAPAPLSAAGPELPSTSAATAPESPPVRPASGA